MRINHNIAALNTHRQMGTANANQSKSMEKLSSGLRINRAGDDAAGLAISEKMRAQIRGLDQASTNAQDGISMIQTTEGALNETHSILQRMRELATQSANDTNTKTDRGEIQKEMNQLTSEINRVGNTTEFNTQSLLKGKDAPVVATAAEVATLTEGVAGVPVGTLTALTTDAKSVVGKASTATVQASTNATTGKASAISETTASVKAVKSTVSMANGIKFESSATDDSLNGKKIEIVQGTTADSASFSYDDGSGNIKITIGQQTGGGSLAANRGELYNQIKSALANTRATDSPTGTAVAGGITTITVLEPSDKSTAVSLGALGTSGVLAGGVDEAEGKSSFTLEKAFTEAGDTIKINGKTYTGVFGTANATKGEFSLGADATEVVTTTTAEETALKTAQATSLAAAINNSDTRYGFVAATTTPVAVAVPGTGAAAAGSVITLTEETGQATGTKLASPEVKGAGGEAKLNFTNPTGKNLGTITLAQNTGAAAGTSNLKVTADIDGNINIQLDELNAANNTVEKIANALKALTASNTTDNLSGLDLSNIEVTGQNWNDDANIRGNSLSKAQGTLVGGIEEVKGQYSFEVDKAFEAGDVVEIKGQHFKAVEGEADATKGEFSISGGDKAAQSAGLADAVSLNEELKEKYNTTTAGTKLTLTEITASGKDVKQADVAVRAAGTPGEFTIKADTLLESGSTFKLDGQTIKVSDKNQHVGYAKGTAIQATNDPQAQVAALAAAINTNAELKAKYEASVNDAGELVLKQTELRASETAPEVATTNSPIGNFTASFQVGANANQSMTIEVGDMRSGSLGLAGDGSEGTIMSSDGKVASYVEVASVTNGTTNTNSEFALDISSHDKATAAISVINDAIEKVSAQRSNLGAYQNRLDHTINNLGTSSENLTAAESRIRDVDMAKEMMNQTRESILAQASQAMLAQANQKPQSVLQLLG